MKTVLINIFILFCTQLYGQLAVDTRLSVKDSIIIITLHNESEYRMTIYNREHMSDVKFFFIDMEGDTIRKNWYSYGEERNLSFHPKEKKRLRYFGWEKINFEGLHFIKVNLKIDYGFNDTVFYKKTGRYPLYHYRDEVVFDMQKILHPCCVKSENE